MKKQILVGLILTLFIFSTVSAQQIIEPNKSNDKEILSLNPTNYTHTVLAEECTATWCPNCPTAAEALYNVYNSGEHDFYYISLVNDMNTIAKKRNQDYSFGIFKIYGFPTIYFDGGNTNMVGHGGTVEATETEYRLLLDQEGQRTPKQPISMDSSVIWEGNAKLTVTITITNEGNLPYFGRMRSYVTEIESRWIDYSGNPYHYAFLDYAVNKFILLMPGKEKIISGTFDGNEQHGNNTYEDITSDNIMVISSVFHWIPQYRIGYQSDEFTQRYFARVADQTTAATPV
jgi:hypothetical protein